MSTQGLVSSNSRYQLLIGPCGKQVFIELRVFYSDFLENSSIQSPFALVIELTS